MAKRLTRDKRNAVLGGVAAGFAEHFDIDPVLVRLAFILLCFLHGAGFIIYVVSWVVMPVKSEPEPAPPQEAGGVAAPSPAPADRFVEEVRQAGESAVEGLRSRGRGPGQGRLFAGFFLIIVGTIFLLDRLFWFQWPWWLSLSHLWPLVLVIVGLGMIFGGARSRS